MTKTDLAGKRLLMDADTIGHFCKGGIMGYLKYLLREQLFILDDVEEELTSRRDAPHRLEVRKAIQGGVLTRLALPDEVAVISEYNALCRTRTAGEAACLSVGRYVKDTIVVTNLPCLANYCQKWGVGFIDTVGLLWVAYNENVLADTDLASFVQQVRRRGGRLTDRALQRLPIVV